MLPFPNTKAFLIHKAMAFSLEQLCKHLNIKAVDKRPVLMTSKKECLNKKACKKKQKRSCLNTLCTSLTVVDLGRILNFKLGSFSKHCWQVNGIADFLSFFSPQHLPKLKLTSGKNLLSREKDYPGTRRAQVYTLILGSSIWVQSFWLGFSTHNFPRDALLCPSKASTWYEDNIRNRVLLSSASTSLQFIEN